MIDCDLGKSGALISRDGFRALVLEVSLGRAGIVMGLEVSRLARNSSDWHRLLEISAFCSPAETSRLIIPDNLAKTLPLPASLTVKKSAADAANLSRRMMTQAVDLDQLKSDVATKTTKALSISSTT